MPVREPVVEPLRVVSPPVRRARARLVAALVAVALLLVLSTWLVATAMTLAEHV